MGEILNITIPLIPISKKNSNQIIWNKRTKRPMIIPSKQYKQYEKDCEQYLNAIPFSAIDCAVNVKCVYYMPTRRRVDLVNLQESTLDILVKYGIIADDNSNIVVSMDGSRVLYDKQNPRTEIEIEIIDMTEKTYEVELVESARQDLNTKLKVSGMNELKILEKIAKENNIETKVL